MLSFNRMHLIEKSHKDNHIVGQRNCWICEGWMQHKFRIEFDVGEHKAPGKIRNVYLHLNVDYFKPQVMKRKGNRW